MGKGTHDLVTLRHEAKFIFRYLGAMVFVLCFCFGYMARVGQAFTATSGQTYAAGGKSSKHLPGLISDVSLSCNETNAQSTPGGW